MAAANLRINTEELAGIVRKINLRIDAMGDMQRDVQFKSSIKEIAADAWSTVWATRGTAIGSNWAGHDLLITGNLRNSLASVSRLNMQLIGNRIILGTDVDYASYVNDSYNFMRINNLLKDPILNEVGDYWKRTRFSTTRRQ